MTGEGEDEEERGSCSITMCGSVCGLKRVLLTQFVAAEQHENKHGMHLQLYLHAV